MAWFCHSPVLLLPSPPLGYLFLKHFPPHYFPPLTDHARVITNIQKYLFILLPQFPCFYFYFILLTLSSLMLPNTSCLMWKSGFSLLICALSLLVWPLIRCLAVVCLLMVVTEWSLVNMYRKGRRVTGDCNHSFISWEPIKDGFKFIHPSLCQDASCVHPLVHLFRSILGTVSSSRIVTVCFRIKPEIQSALNPL